LPLSFSASFPQHNTLFLAAGVVLQKYVDNGFVAQRGYQKEKQA
jgi:hypothetical protein